MKPILLVFSYARRYWGVLVLTVGADVLLVGVQLVIPLIIRTLLAPFTSGTLSGDTLTLITRLTLLILALYLARAGLKFVSVYMSHVAGWSVVSDMRKFIYEIGRAHV